LTYVILSGVARIQGCASMKFRTRLTAFSVFAFASLLAACGSSGGSGTLPPGGGGTRGGGNPPPTPTATPAISGQIVARSSAIANARIVFTCGCSAQAGTATADANGNYTLTTPSTALPASPSPTYTAVPGRNYLIIGGASSSHTEAWTMAFLGKIPSHNLYLSTSNITDEFTTAASLYIFYNSQASSDQSFDLWNFNTIAAWTQSLRSSGGNNSAEKKLVSDVLAAQQAGQTLFPGAPAWDFDRPGTNATIASDLRSVHNSGDSALPTPCPRTGCTGTPSP
jgi:hypothetical protein